MDRPRVSILIPVYGDTDRLKETIDSVLAQSYENIEVIVVGNVSEVAEAYGDKITCYTHERGDVASALNLGIKKMAGHYFSWLAPGDVYYQQKIETQMDLISDADDTIAVSGWTKTTGGGRKVRVQISDRRLEQYPSCFLALANDTRLSTCAMLIPKAVLKGENVFDGSLPPSQDYTLLNRLVMAGANFKMSSQPLLRLGPPPQESSNDPVAEEYDVVYSEIVNTLRYEDVLGYFGSRQEAIAHYKKTLSSGLPRTAAFLIARIVKESAATDGQDVTKKILLNDVSRLPETQMATDADTLLSKITQPSTRKKLFFCSAHWLTGGMERVMSTLFRELEHDYEIFLITPYDPRESHIDIPDFVTSVKISDDLFVKHFDSLALSYALLFDVDVAVGFINLFEKQLNLYKLCVGTKIKTIASNHEYYFYPYTSPTHFHVVDKRLSAFETCDALLWANNFNAALCGLYANNNYVIGNPNKFEVTQKTDEAPRENIVLCVGRFNDYVKRIDRMLECFSLVLNKVPDAKLVLVGKYDSNARIRQNDTTTVNSLIRKLAIPPDSIHFTGELQNVQDYYVQAKVLLLTSNSEGFAMVLNEAACFGVPAVSNYIPGIEDIVVDGENGFITEQDDIKSMAERVSSLLDNNVLWKKQSNNAKKRVVAYDSAHIGDKWRYLVNTLMNSSDRSDMRAELSAKLGYKVSDEKLLLKAVSKELNDIFYFTTGNAGGQYEIGDSVSLIFSKIRRVPAKLKANVEYEGWLKTGNKAATRLFRISRRILKI